MFKASPLPRTGRSRLFAWALASAGLAATLAGTGAARAEDWSTRGVRAQGGDRVEPPAHPVPRLKFSLEGFSVGTPFGTSVALMGAHVEIYPVSRRWVRGGFGMAGGAGNGAFKGGSANVQYGLLGIALGVQYPGRVTPFVEGHVAGGLMGASVDRPIVVNGVSVDQASGTTWLYGRGVDLGAEVYTFGRAYLSGSVGWMRTTWGSPDPNQSTPMSVSDVRFVNVTSDSLLWKLGLGI